MCEIFFSPLDSVAFSGSSAMFPAGTGPIHVGSLGCTGSENNLTDCSFNLDVSQCSHSNDAGLQCSS